MKSIVFKLVLLGLLFTKSVWASELKYQITGTVLEAPITEPIPYATVALYSKLDSKLVTGTISNENGQFIIDKISSGDYYLTISFMGYKEHTIDNITLDGVNSVIDVGIIKLNLDMQQLAEVEIKSSSAPIKNLVDRQVLNVASNILAAGGTAADALKVAPSIQTDAEGNVLLRGSANFIVLIDGRPTTLNAQDVLAQTPANSIKNIEIITNPSVKYDASGGGGIINIILKKGYASGFNGVINTSIGTKNKYSSDVTLNLNKEKTNYSFGINWRDYTTVSFSDYYRTLFETDRTHYATIFQDRRVTKSNLGFRFGLDYHPNKKQTIRYSIHTGNTLVDLDVYSNNAGYSIPEDEVKFSRNYFKYYAKPKFFTNNLSYNINLNEKGNRLDINAYYSYIDYYILNSQNLSTADSNHNIVDDTPVLKDVLNENNSNDLKVDVDLTLVSSEKTTIETGLSYHLYNRFLDITYAEFDYGSMAWVNHPDFTNKYTFDETIYAVYANMNTSFWGLNASIGLRLEYMDRLLNQQESNTQYNYDKLNFFPGISLSKDLSKTQQLKLAFTNRINRPDEYMMNPFPEFEDDYFYSEGNPFLIPEIVRNLELGYSLSKNGNMFSSNFYFRKTSDKIEQELLVREDGKIATRFFNDSKDRTIGLELVANVKLYDWWSLNANTNLYDYTISLDIFNEEIESRNLSYSAQLINTFNITNSTSLQITSYYRSKTARAQGELSDFYYVDLGLKQQFFNNHLTLSLQLKDVLQSFNYKLETKTPNSYILGDFNNESPVFMFNLSFKFNNYKKKTKDVQTDFDM